MNQTEQEIQQMLLSAPKPNAPVALKEKLIEQIKLAAGGAAQTPFASSSGPGAWLRRWWPAMAPAALSIACAAVLTTQQSEISELKRTNQTLLQEVAVVQAAAARQVPGADEGVPVTDSAASEQREIAKLRELASQLSAEIGQLEQIRIENDKLRVELARPLAGGPSQGSAAEIEEARQRAMATMCVNNMKQLGLAVRVWALDNSNMTPEQLIFMTNEMGSPKILVCPADTGRQPAKDWSLWTPSNCSYEYLAPGASDGKEPMRVLFRCPIHGNIGLCDGSVQMSVGKRHPETLVERDGKIYYEPSQSPPSGAASQPPQGGAAPQEQAP